MARATRELNHKVVARRSFSRADPERAASQRDLLRKALTSDWRRLITGVKGHLLGDDEAEGLCAALDGVHLIGIRSEHFHHYFAAIQAIGRRDRTGAETAIRSLGNALRMSRSP